jgi:hypothetical protein
MLVSPATAVAIVLAQQPGNGDNGGQGEDFGKSSPLGLLLLILFLIAVVLLVRSMTKHLKRLPESFDKEEEPEAGRGDSNADPADTASAEATPDGEPEAASEDTPNRQRTEARAKPETSG